jgi:hypothetical protein
VVCPQSAPRMGLYQHANISSLPLRPHHLLHTHTYTHTHTHTHTHIHTHTRACAFDAAVPQDYFKYDCDNLAPLFVNDRSVCRQHATVFPFSVPPGCDGRSPTRRGPAHWCHIDVRSGLWCLFEILCRNSSIR